MNGEEGAYSFGGLGGGSRLQQSEPNHQTYETEGPGFKPTRSRYKFGRLCNIPLAYFTSMGSGMIVSLVRVQKISTRNL